jgi:glycosyltransferase involved in cell wall biosynthesis
MKPATAVVMCRADPNETARPHQMIRWLADDYRVSVFAPTAMADERVGFIEMPKLPFDRVARPLRVLRLAARRYRPLLWDPRLTRVKEELAGRDFDLVVCHDLELLPLAAAIRGSGRLLFDARDYYPRHFEDRPTWRLLYQPLNRRLCRDHLPQCDRVMTVSPGLASAFERDYGVTPEIVRSLPPFHDLGPSPTDPGRIRIVHHGAANPTRSLEVMVRVMDHLDDRFTLDLLLVPVDPGYLRRLRNRVAGRSGVRILDPVPYRELVSSTNSYDIGLFLCPPNTFNLRHALPNKLFEFIQARLAVAIGPSPDMKDEVERHGCGIVSDDFEPATMARLLATLTAADIDRLKAGAHAAAAQLHAGVNRAKVLGMVTALLAGRG